MTTSIAKKGMRMMIENNIIWTSLVGMFIKETNHNLLSVDRSIEVGDILQKDDKTNKVINYGQLNDIINTKEFNEWIKKTMKESDKNGVSDI